MWAHHSQEQSLYSINGVRFLSGFSIISRLFVEKYFFKVNFKKK